MIAIVILVAILVSACGSSHPVAPTPQVPQVAGTYNGTVVVSLPEVNESVTCPANTAVTQATSTVTIAPIVLGGICGGLSIPMGSVTIDPTGAISGSGLTGTFPQPSCGGSYTFVASGGFFGRELRLSMNATSAVCLNFNFTAVLTR